MTTAYRSKNFAYALTRQGASDSIAKIGASLFNATVDLNPHQLDAALFAFRSPLSRGSILADEVGLGKTIEAGIIISQLWAERKLYQLFSYLLNQRKIDQKTQTATGILIYPTIKQEYDLQFRYQNHNILIKTINLNSDWRNIDERLKEVIADCTA